MAKQGKASINERDDNWNTGWHKERDQSSIYYQFIIRCRRGCAGWGFLSDWRSSDICCLDTFSIVL
ncbi:hypothetical protein DPMN_144674 [Dreissena polymorpha]|uniref:Uncharacterized protein n=1 Tax=Dreissena polymorpha TaxID=45954 RepID=A0A9D4J094_DREPO|nr:hypothetical protein DPMN_144674 [Dreissena polymorpha]